MKNIDTIMRELAQYTRLQEETAAIIDGLKDELKAIAKSAAELIDVKIVFKAGSVEIYNKDGKLIETVTENNGKLAYTGNNVNVVLVVSIIAIIALAITVVAKRTKVNAR